MIAEQHVAQIEQKSLMRKQSVKLVEPLSLFDNAHFATGY